MADRPSCPTLGDCVLVAEKSPPLEKQFWDAAAYLGRYGHQSVETCRSLTFADLRALAESVEELVKAENRSATTEET